MAVLAGDVAVVPVIGIALSSFAGSRQAATLATI
jgi:hypothetical protein